MCGQDLAWFFEGLVYGEEIINYGVTALDDHRVEFARQGDLIIPTEVRITFADGTSVIEPWDGVDARRTLAYPDSPPIVCAEIDPDRRIALDLRWSDNGACRSLDLWSLTALIARVTLSLQNTLLIWGGL